MKYLLVIVVVGLVVAWLLRKPRVARNESDRTEGSRTDVAQMVRCAHCQVHLPSADALADGDRRYCSEEHRRLGTR
ncbi:MAG: PP0621 family protein [Aquabacterium sp.]